MTARTPLRMGVMDQGWAPAGCDDVTALQNTARLVRVADELGYDTAWIGEHHHQRPDKPFWGRISATEVFLGYVAAQTRSVALGTGVRILGTTPVLRTAEEMTTLAALTGGRVDFGIGSGFGQFGMKSRAERIAEFCTTLDELLLILREKAPDGTPPVSPSSPVDITTRLWAAARDEGMVAHLAKTDINLVVGQAEPAVTQAGYIRSYRQAGGRGRTRGVRLVCVAPTRAQAIADSEKAAELYYEMFSQMAYHKEAVSRGLIRETPADHQELLSQIHFIAGTPDDVIPPLADYIATTGISQLDIMVNIPGMNPAHAERTLRLVQTEVRPALTPAYAHTHAGAA
ncbi:LLM class flavin-dependent oxidoreductase [Acetobacter musti]|uniref:LLM class flavin-dependent oxidoreductase n=1 Tax=Acetobacter musti TaxID=864732 RepID=A0ABX0JN36_9PROT|nr:LLM class flavin-dependent oxidoreductase [Acetobacter musti]NHN84886.1 LLM class flavin-dependent oxidoreductase [Acetobacter musti]